MIGSTTVFSTADLNSHSSRLFGQIWYKRQWIWIEVIQENEEEGTTLVLFISGNSLEVKTNLIKNLISYNSSIGEKCPIELENLIYK